MGNCILKWNNSYGTVLFQIILVDMFDNDAHPKCQTHELCSQFGSPG